MGLSYAQIIQLFQSLYGLHLTDGEIAGIVRQQHSRWLPAYEQLKADIRASPSIHADETSWPIQSLQGQGYGWVLAASDSLKSCFALENSRGAPHAQKLLQGYSGIRITDDYGVYRSLPGLQQLCWAHLYRAIRDLRYNENLPDEHLAYVGWWYEQFASMYQQLRDYLTEPYDRSKREDQAEVLWQQAQALCSQHSEPVKLTKLKAQLMRAGKNKLFICLSDDTPCDNNRAERDLRPLVLKRKRSFGSKTERGAQALATVLSICTTTWRSNPSGYFRSLAALG
jgi:transposase